MSFNPSFNTKTPFIDTGDIERFDDIQYFADYATIQALPIKYLQVTYVDQSTGDRYRWDGVSLILMIGGAGAVNSVTKSGNTIIVSGTANDPIISTIQELNTTSIPTFNNVISNNPATLANHLTRKTEVDTQVNAVQTNLTNHINDTANPHAVTKTQVGLSEVPNLKQNLTAVTDPTTSNDNTQGYAVGSKWVNTILNRVWFATNVSTGNAVWKRGVSLINELDDVDTTAVQTTNTLAWSGTQWIPAITQTTMDITNGILYRSGFNGNANDASTYNMTPTTTGTITYPAGLLNQAYSSAGNGNYITYNGASASHLSFPIDQSFTISVWVNTTATGTTERYICSKGTGANGEGWTFSVSNFNNSYVNCQLMDKTGTRNLQMEWRLGAGVLNNGAWHHLCLVHRAEYGHTQGSLDLYVDGVNRSDVLVVPTSTLLETDDITTDATTPFAIGARSNGEAGEWEGLIDELVIFNFAMYAQNVQSIYNSGAGTETYTAITTQVPHIHQQSNVVGLVSRLNAIENAVIADDIRLDNHVAGSAEKHTGAMIDIIATGNNYTAGSLASVITSLDSAIQTNKGQVDSVVAGTNINVNAVDPQNPIVNLNTTLTGLVSVATTTQPNPTSGGQLSNKTYTDTKVASVSSGNTNLLTISGTATAPVVNNQIGASQPPILIVGGTGSGNFTTSNNADFNLMDGNISIGKAPFNSITGHFDNMLNSLQQHSLPKRIRLVETGNSANFSEFILHTNNGSTANQAQFIGVFDSNPLRSSVSTLSGSVHVIFAEKQRTIAQGTNILVSTSTDKETITINTTGVATTTDLSNHTTDTSIHYIQANINPDNFININRFTRNILSRVDIKNIIFAGGVQNNNSTTLSANESLTINIASGASQGYNTIVSLAGSGYPQKPWRSHSSVLRNSFFSVRLTGANWSGGNIGNMHIGWATKQWFENAGTNIVNSSYTYAPFWDTNNSSANKAFMMSFLGTSGYLHYNGTSNIISRTGYTTDSNSAVGDILSVSFNTTGGVILYWNRPSEATTPKSNCFYFYPNEPTTNSNGFTNSDVVPIITPYDKGPGWEFEVLSDRDFSATGATLGAINENYFY